MTVTEPLNHTIRDTLRVLASALSWRSDPDAVRTAIATLGWEPLLRTAVDLRLAPALIARLREKRALPDIPPLVLPGGRRTVTAEIDSLWAGHRARSRILADRLEELVAALNSAGLEPVLLKGAASLATGVPEWRSMRDIDLLLAGRDAVRAHEVAGTLGYRPAAGSSEKAGKHHFQPLFRDDLPGWVEIHQRAASHRAEGLLSTGSLLETCGPVRLGTARARIFSAPAATLHAVIHHHVGHRGDKSGALDLKGVFEFAAEVVAMPQEDRATLVAMARRHPRLLAALDLWVAAAHEFFAMEVEPPLVLAADAVARARRGMDRVAEPGPRYGGIWEEFAFAADRDRLLRLPSGRTAPGRLALRARTLTSMLRPMINLNPTNE